MDHNVFFSEHFFIDYAIYLLISETKMNNIYVLFKIIPIWSIMSSPNGKFFFSKREKINVIVIFFDFPFYFKVGEKYIVS